MRRLGYILLLLLLMAVVGIGTIAVFQNLQGKSASGNYAASSNSENPSVLIQGRPIPIEVSVLAVEAKSSGPILELGEVSVKVSAETFSPIFAFLGMQVSTGGGELETIIRPGVYLGDLAAQNFHSYVYTTTSVLPGGETVISYHDGLTVNLPHRVCIQSMDPQIENYDYDPTWAAMLDEYSRPDFLYTMQRGMESPEIKAQLALFQTALSPEYLTKAIRVGEANLVPYLLGYTHPVTGKWVSGAWTGLLVQTGFEKVDVYFETYIEGQPFSACSVTEQRVLDMIYGGEK